MNPTLIAVIGIRSAALAALLAGHTSTANALYALADLIESGRATDAEMGRVAELLKSRELTDADWTELSSRLSAAQSVLHAPG